MSKIEVNPNILADQASPAAQGKDIFWYSINSSGPFTREQFKQLSELVKADEAAAMLCLSKTNAAARTLILSMQTSDKTKTQARDELIEIRELALKLRKAIAGRGIGADVALAENFIQSGDDTTSYQGSFFLLEQIISLDELMLFTEGAVSIAENKANKGASIKLAERHFYQSIRRAFEQATGDDCGFWQFFRAVTGTLVGVLPEHLSRGSFDAWRSTWRKMGGGKNWRKNK